MIYVDIDIAKQTHYVAFMSSAGEIFIGMEFTTHYAKNITNILYTKGFQVCIINPIQTSSLRKSSIRKTKTDSVDTYFIIKALMLNHNHLFTERDFDIYN